MSSTSSAVVEHDGRTLLRTDPLPTETRAPDRTPLFTALFVIVALLPVAWMLHFAHSTARNIPYYDEIDTAIALLIRLDEGVSVSEFVGQMVAVNNEHRTVTSRLLFALSYGLTRSVNFIWVGTIGNACIVAACALMVIGVRSARRRLRLGVILAFMLYHFGHYESFLWSGSSIDHFQVITLVVGSCVALNAAARPFTLLAVMAALLASFTLAHGLVVWPVGAALLARDRRWRELAGWSGVALLVAAIFLAGFHVNPGHHIGAGGIASLIRIFFYWLNVMGAPLAFGNLLLAQSLGAALVLYVVARSVLMDWRRQRDTAPLLWFALGACLLVAIGRAEISGTSVASRYLVLGALAWSLVLLDALDRLSSRLRPRLALVCALPVLVGFNFAQTSVYRGDAFTFLEHRDRAALRYRQYGEDGRAAATLHPLPHHSTQVLAHAAARGLYELPPLCELREFPDATEGNRLSYYVDEFTLDANAAYLEGWLTVPDRRMRRGEIHLVLRSPESFFVFSTVPARRPDVVKAFSAPGWEFSGFRAAIRRSRLPVGDYQVGFLVTGDDPPEYIMTEHSLHLAGAGSVTFTK